MSELDDITRNMLWNQTLITSDFGHLFADLNDSLNVEFSFYVPGVRSAVDIGNIYSGFVQLITASNILAAFAHPELDVPLPRSIKGTAASLFAATEHSSTWSLDVVEIRQGSLFVRLKPKGKHAKEVTREKAGLLATLSCIVTISGFSVQAASTTIRNFFDPPAAVNSTIGIYEQGAQSTRIETSVDKSNFQISLPVRSTIIVTVQTPGGQMLTLTLKNANMGASKKRTNSSRSHPGRS